jgi:hypothetical protein
MISRAALLAAACSVVAAPGPAAQTTGTVDVSLATVRYDGFLPSGAGSVTPALRWERPGAAVTARGTYLRFESGHRSLQALVAASVFTPPTLLPPGWRGELAFSGGGSSYADFASFWHATGEARLHLVGSRRGVWVGASAGRTSYGSAPRPVTVAGIGGWARRGWLTVTASASRSWIGDTTYSDVVSAAELSVGSWGLNGSAGVRLSSRGGGHGVYGEASATLAISGRTALFVAGGRYPTDPVSGSVAGRYASAGVRLRTGMPRRRVPRTLWPTSRPPGAADGDMPSGAHLEVRAAPDGVRLLVRVTDAARVDLAADFTDWQPVALHPAGDDVWEAVLTITSGVHRLNIRIDGGRWTAPAGTTRVTDEFGGEVGIVTIP